MEGIGRNKFRGSFALIKLRATMKRMESSHFVIKAPGANRAFCMVSDASILLTISSTRISSLVCREYYLQR